MECSQNPIGFKQLVFAVAQDCKKVTENGVELKPIVFALFSQNEKSATRISSKLLISSVDQLGLEPRTSRL